MNNYLLEQIHKTKLLGVIITDDLSWTKNTSYLIKKAYKRMTILRKLFEFKISVTDLLHIYILYIRSIVKQNCVVWTNSITNDDSNSLERIQKVALRIIYKHNYISYDNALELSGLPTLCDRRYQLSLRFALKCSKEPKTQHMFPQTASSRTRHQERYTVPFAYTERHRRSAIPSMARQLNENSIA